MMDKETVLDALGVAPGETRKAKAALIDYALMRRRSLLSLARMYRDAEQAPTRRLPTLEKWSSLYNWQSRVARLDKLNEDDRVEKWIRRTEELNESDWCAGESLKTKALEYLGKLTDNPNLIQLANILEHASKLQRLATGSPTETVELYGQSLIKSIEHELARLGYTESTGRLPISEGPANPKDDTVSK